MGVEDLLIKNALQEQSRPVGPPIFTVTINTPEGPQQVPVEIGIFALLDAISGQLGEVLAYLRERDIIERAQQP